jgi:hypothetical protein
MAGINSLRKRPEVAKDKSRGNLLYVGNREEVTIKIADRFPKAMVFSTRHMPSDWTGVEEVFFDSVSLSMQEIIGSISKLGSTGIRKRIISREGDFFIGSDSSNDMGITMML